MIKRIFSNNKSFREVTFEKGFNVVLADKHPNSTKKDSRNGVGKSLLVEVIHFCLGADTKPEKGLLVPKLKEHIFSMELSLGGKTVIVHRGILDPNNVNVEGDFLSWPIKPQFNKSEEAHSMSVDTWRLVLGYFFFNLPIETNKYSPTYRSLVSYFIRKGIGAFNEPFKYFPIQPEWSVQVNNSYLLGLNWEYAKEFQEVKDREKTLDELRKASKLGLLDDTIGTMGELQAERIRLFEELTQFEQQLKEFKVHPQYKEVQREANDITDKIHVLLNKTNSNERILREYEKSVSAENDVSAQKIKEVYGKAGVIFREDTLRTLQSVETFHETIIINRKEYLENEISRLQNDIIKWRKEIETLSDQKSEFMKLLQSHGALEEYDVLQSKKIKLSEKLERVKNAISNLSNFEEGKSSLKIENEELMQKARLDKIERSEKIDKAISLFNKNSNALYDKPGRLTIDIQKSGYKFNVEIERSGSQGIDYMKIFCYDLTLAQIWSDIVQDRVLIHDSTIFDGVDERQVAKAIELVASESEAKGFQYICTINSDDVPSSEFSNDFIDKFDSATRITLTDKEPEQSLLGFRF